MSVKTEPCPCGKGKIITTMHGDYWNRYKTSEKIECNYCRNHYQWMGYQHKKEYHKRLVTNEEAAEIKALKKAREEQHRRELMEGYSIEYDANLSSFKRSAKIMLKKGKTRVTYNRHYINAHILTPPHDIQVEALGAAKRRSPYLFEALRRIPTNYWVPIPDNADNNRIVVKAKNSSAKGLNKHNSA